MNLDNDYDEDGNNIVPCPICMDVYCPSKEDDECPEEKDFVKYHTQKEMDVVYVLGTGSKWKDNELRYSLRSVEKHLPHRNVVVVGERPEWLQNVIHIAIPDGFANVHGGKYKNVIRKIRGACTDERVSKEFVFMNDDFFFLEDCIEIKPHTMGTLRSMIDDFRQKYGDPDGRNQYINMLVRTLQYLRKYGVQEPHSYALHYPIVYEKRKFFDMTEHLNWLEKAYSWRTIYGNLFFKASVERREDTKLNRAEEVFEFTQRNYPGDFLSISDHVALEPMFQEWLAIRFPKKSKYENGN